MPTREDDDFLSLGLESVPLQPVQGTPDEARELVGTGAAGDLSSSPGTRSSAPVSASALDEVNMSLWERSPVGAIGLILQNFGAGLRGESVLPSDHYLEGVYKNEIMQAQKVSSALAIAKEVGGAMQLMSPEQQVGFVRRLRSAGTPPLATDMALLFARRPGPAQEFQLKMEATAAFSRAARYLKAHVSRMVDMDPRSRDPAWKAAAQKRIADDLMTNAGTPQKLREIVTAQGPSMGLTPQHFAVMNDEKWFQNMLVEVGAVESPERMKAREKALGEQAAAALNPERVSDAIAKAASVYDKIGAPGAQAVLNSLLPDPAFNQALVSTFETKDANERFSRAVGLVGELLDKGQDATALTKTAFPGLSTEQNAALGALARLGPTKWAQARGLAKGAETTAQANETLKFLEANGVPKLGGAAALAALKLNIPEGIAQRVFQKPLTQLTTQYMGYGQFLAQVDGFIAAIDDDVVGLRGAFNRIFTGYVNQLTKQGQAPEITGALGLQEFLDYAFTDSELKETKARNYARRALNLAYASVVAEKGSDRVAVWDIQNALKRIGALDPAASAPALRESMEDYKQEMFQRAQGVRQQAQGLAGNQDILEPIAIPAPKQAPGATAPSPGGKTGARYDPKTKTLIYTNPDGSIEHREVR